MKGTAGLKLLLAEDGNIIKDTYLLMHLAFSWKRKWFFSFGLQKSQFVLLSQSALTKADKTYRVLDHGYPNQDNCSFLFYFPQNVYLPRL